MAPVFRITKLTFNDDRALDVPREGVVVIVGPNNAGKSAALRDIASWAVVNPLLSPMTVLSDIEVDKRGDADELVAWLEEHAYAFNRPDGRHFRGLGAGEATEHNLRVEWNNGPVDFTSPEGHAAPRLHLPQLLPYFLFLATADQRLSLIGSVAPHNPVSDAPSNPLQVIFLRADLEERLSQLCHEAFGESLSLSRVVGGELALYVGEPTVEPSLVPDPTYLSELERLPKLQGQGDGMRSFMGLLLALMTSRFQVILVDEPEAFLHPPQARLLGKRLATDASDTQVFVATHDVHILQGALEAPEQSVTVVRLRRDGALNHPSVLPAERVRDLWQDPLLRYSNTLEGLFHKGVVVCEADTDARFYGSVLDAVTERDHRPAHDLLFTHTGGKDRLKTVVKALRAVEVPVAVVADFDVLRDEAATRLLVEALGGVWDESKARDWRTLSSAVNDLGQAPPRLAVQNSINELLDDNQATGVLTREDVDAIRRTLRLNDGWQIVKRGGLQSVPGGEAYAAAERLVDGLKTDGLFAVPVGELERWIPGIGSHGTRWVVEVLDQRLHDDPARPAWAFVSDLARWFTE